MRRLRYLVTLALAAAAACNTTGDTSGAVSALERDVNGDGSIDLIVGAPLDDGRGRVYIFLGPLSPEDAFYLTPTGQVAAVLAADADVILESQLRLDEEPRPDSFGAAVTTGDVSGDGIADIVVGAPGFDGGGRDATGEDANIGRAYVFLGGPHLVTGTRREAATAEAILYGESRLAGDPAGGNFGFAVEAADLDGDGSADVVVGAVGYDRARGRAYIFRGDRLHLVRGSTDDAFAYLADRIVAGEDENAFLGSSLAAGDIGRNGRDDLVIGAPGAGAGRVYVFAGGPALVSGPLIVASAAQEIFLGEAQGDAFGTAVGAADVDGDDAADVLVGAPGFDLGFAAPAQLAGEPGVLEAIGRCYVFAARTFEGRAAGLADVIVTGEGDGDLFGSSVGAGDIDADARVDLIVGAPGVGDGVYNPETLLVEGAYVGRAYVFRGGARLIPVDGPTVRLGALDSYLRLTGERTDERLGASVSAADVDRDGIADLLAGAPPEGRGIAGIAFMVRGAPGIANDLLTGAASIAVLGRAANDAFSAALR